MKERREAASSRPDDICPRPDRLPQQPTEPLVPAIWPASVYRCSDPDQARGILAGELPGYVYSRDGHPNADLLSEKCRELHRYERAIVCGSGMAALALAALSQLEPGQHSVVSNQLYGRTLQLFNGELVRLGIECTVADTCDLDQVARSIRPNTRLIVAETISNPLLRVADIAGLATIAARAGARLLVDNTFACPTVFRPAEHGADLVMESLTKIINGHSDVLLGLLAGREPAWSRVPLLHSIWGFTPSPFDCWLATRGLGTLALRSDRASHNATAAAEFLATNKNVIEVHYPGLASHRDHALAVRQFGSNFGSMVTFTLRGGIEAARRFIAAAEHIPFAPSLGDLSTTLSHPASTSHRGMSAAERAALGIDDGTIRLSTGIESREAVLAALEQGLLEVSEVSEI